LSDSEIKTKPIRVLIVAPSLDMVGGQAVQAARLREKFSGEPELQVGFVPINPRLPGPLRFLQKIKYLRTVVTSLMYRFLLFREINRYDIIHIFSASYASFVIAPAPALKITKLFGKKAILNYRSGQARDHLTRWPGAIKTIKRFDRVVTPSAYLVDVFAEFDLKAQVVHNFVETEKYKFRERVPLGTHFLSNRNFESHYNVSCVLRAFALIQQKYPEAKLTVAGDGPEREKLKTLAAKLNLQNIEFLGLVAPDKMPELCEMSDIMLNSPSVDNMPNSLIEAYAAGLPIVSTNAGGIPYIVRHGETGLLVEIDDHEAMAREAVRLLEDPQLAEKIISAGKREAEKYTWAAVREDWLDLYRGLAVQDDGQG
jgi:glycosyltransferase involved in cell wall biosynthesis